MNDPRSGMAVIGAPPGALPAPLHRAPMTSHPLSVVVADSLRHTLEVEKHFAGPKHGRSAAAAIPPSAD